MICAVVILEAESNNLWLKIIIEWSADVTYNDIAKIL